MRDTLQQRSKELFWARKPACSQPVKMRPAGNDGTCRKIISIHLSRMAGYLNENSMHSKGTHLLMHFLTSETPSALFPLGDTHWLEHAPEATALKPL
jgi:hypothetical protein